MRVRILDLDGSVAQQSSLVVALSAEVVPLQDWGPRLRMACSFGRFRRFEQLLGRCLPADEPTLTFCGSGDFHHVSLALVRRLATPFNLLVLDKHPDWMRAIPFLHCGTWLRHAARLPLVRRVYHVGGDLDFDNAWRWLAPRDELRRGKVTVFPAVRRFTRGPWRRVRNLPARDAGQPVSRERLGRLLRPFAPALARWPLYVSLDKDVMTGADAVVNWDSGHLRLAEVSAVLGAFVAAAGGNVIGIDVVGDWSPVRLGGTFRRLLHWTEHPALAVDPAEAYRTNERTNLALLQSLAVLLARPSGRATRPARATAGRRAG
jgi:arginase family enzyme